MRTEIGAVNTGNDFHELLAQTFTPRNRAGDYCPVRLPLQEEFSRERNGERSMSTVYLNTLTITSSLITKILIIDASVRITTGQSCTGSTVGHSDGVWSVSISCGRSGSEDVAQSYVEQTGGMYHMLVQPNFCPNTSDYSNVPQQMNFWFQANVTFGSHTVPLFFGQDGVNATNYWWIGGSAILNSSPYKSPMAYINAGSLYQLSFVDSHVDQVVVTAAS